MPPPKSLPVLQQELRTLLIENPADALKALRDLLPPASEKHRTAATLLGELNDTNKQSLRGTLSNDELQRAYNRIRAATLDLIDSLQTADFEAITPDRVDKDGKKARQGEILYRIPHTMPVERETRCTVRIALDGEAIVEDILLDEHVTLKPLTRVSDFMQVDLVDPSERGVFRIRGINSPEQLIDETGYTEWTFYVVPQREGTYPLMIKVAVIEVLHGKERRKEIVLEEQIEIKADARAKEGRFKSAGETLVFVPPPASVAPISEPSERPRRSRSPLKAAALFLAFLIFSVGTTWAVAPQEAEWVVARYVQDTPEAYETYIRKYPESKHREKAVFRRAELLDVAAVYRAYQEEFPGGTYVPRAIKAVDALETRALEDLMLEPTASRVRAFLENFPESPRLKAVESIVDTSAALRQELLPVVRQRLDQLRRKSEIQGQNNLSSDPGLSEKQPQTNSTDPVQTPTRLAADSAELRLALQTNKPEALEAFLNKHAASPLAGEARRRLDALRPARPAADGPAMVLVKGGTFEMGDVFGEGLASEKPVHSVTVSDFYMGQYEVTFNEYDRFCEATQRRKPDDKGWGRGRRPAVNVSWCDAVAYCNWLSKIQNFKAVYNIQGDCNVTADWSANGYRLPTEAEWEYSAREGGRKVRFGNGKDVANPREMNFDGRQIVKANYSIDGIYRRETMEVGGFSANTLNLFDMSGNVYEWCWDWYAEDYYKNSEKHDPKGPLAGGVRSVRGGSWLNRPNLCRAAIRNFRYPTDHLSTFGFRVIRHP